MKMKYIMSNVSVNLCVALLGAFFFFACTDYESVVNEKYEEWLANLDESSSSVDESDSSSSQKVVNSSGAKQSGSSSSVPAKDSASSSSRIASPSSESHDDGNSSDSEESSSSQNAAMSSAEEASSSSRSMDVVFDDSEYNEFEKTLLDKRDGHVYKTETIGNQIWMAENLKYDYNEETAKSYCYDDDENNCAKYGRLYTWAAAMDSAGAYSDAGKGCGLKDVEFCKASGVVRGVCPANWHLPSADEWKILLETVDGKNTAGKVLKSSTGWERGESTDSFGFSALPGGYKSYGGKFFDEGFFAIFWSSSEHGYDDADVLILRGEVDFASLNNYKKSFSHSIRCIKD